MNEIDSQIARFKKGFPALDIVAAATPQKGIKVLDETAVEDSIRYCENAKVGGKCKFVPASGAASRMFKDIFALKEEAVSVLAREIEKFAFYSPDIFGVPEDSVAYRSRTASMLLSDEGLGYGQKPKGVLKFHRYPDGECRTAFAEHLVEGQEYMRNEDGSVNLTFTVSPEHRALFEEALAEVKESYERRYGVNFNVRFTYQDPATNTVAVDPDNNLFLKEDGTPLTRPAGHGALIHNLNDVEEEIVVIKNIDNVSCERLLPLTAKYKKVLMGECLRLRDTIFEYKKALDAFSWKPVAEPYPFLPGYNGVRDDVCATPECQELCRDIEQFLLDELCIEMPLARTCEERVEALKKKLDRPIRVCGMVRNEGEPGGGPFIIRAKDGSTSLQILESVQIDKNDPAALAAQASSTHFNPVDLVCCLRGSDGEKFNLPDFVDPETGFISQKSYEGRPLKALELPGLWNGAMSDWNTLFVEVPLETFNPVKVVLDLLRPAHQG